MGTGELVAIVGGVVALVTIMAEAIKFLLEHFTKREEKAQQNQCTICQQNIRDLHSLIVRTGEDGVPLIYFPRQLMKDMLETQKIIVSNQGKIVEHLHNVTEKLIIVSSQQDRTAEILDRIEQRMPQRPI